MYRRPRPGLEPRGRSEDAPEPFVATQLKAIVGIEIAIAPIEGKWKASQNRPPADREGVASGLEFQGGDASLAMTKIVRERPQPSGPSGAAKACG